jgi:hypothetical protein
MIVHLNPFHPIMPLFYVVGCAITLFGQVSPETHRASLVIPCPNVLMRYHVVRDGHPQDSEQAPLNGSYLLTRGSIGFPSVLPKSQSFCCDQGYRPAASDIYQV